ncbi:MAG: amidohydrolase family protein [Litorilinea sp.]
MAYIDTHCHASPHWYEPVESLLAQMDRHHIEKAVLVQLNGQYNNTYQFECVARYPDRLASVALVDATQPDAPAQLARLAEQGAQGVRLAANMRSPGDDPLAIWRQAQTLGMSVSCSGGADLFAEPAFAELAAAVPDLPIIIEHMASLKAKPGELPPAHLCDRIFELARYPNLYMKIHGLGEICTRNMPITEPFPFDRTGIELLRRAYAAFGADRLMWGSDYPPVSGREGYGNALQLTMAELADCSPAEHAQIFGGVAAQVYGLQGSGSSAQ